MLRDVNSVFREMARDGDYVGIGGFAFLYPLLALLSLLGQALSYVFLRGKR